MLTPAEIKSLNGEEIELVAVATPYEGPHGTEVDFYVINPEAHKAANYVFGKCGCCGSHRLKYTSHFVVKATGEGFVVGADCAAKLSNLDPKESLRIQGAMLVLKHRSIRRANVAKFLDAHREYREAVEWAGSDNAHPIASDIYGKIGKNAYASEKQIALICKLRDQVREFEARKAADALLAASAAPFPATGRATVTGEVLALKGQETVFGYVTKMLVRGECGNKFWGTAPGSLLDEGVERGDTVSFTASVEKSNNDDHFGFFKRPTKAVVVSRKEPEAAAA